MGLPKRSCPLPAVHCSPTAHSWNWLPGTGFWKPLGGGGGQTETSCGGGGGVVVGDGQTGRTSRGRGKFLNP